MDKQVAARIARRFIALPLEKRARYLQTMLAEGISPAQLPIPALSDEFEQLPLSYAQERQWFLWQLEPDSAAYHIPLSLRLLGNLDLAALQHSFTALLGRHAALRTCLEQRDGTPTQVVLEQVQMQVQVCADEALDDFVQRLTRQPFDLANAPLLRAGVARLGDGEHVLVVIMHHIVSDGWSIKVMLGDLIEFYQAALEGREPRLPALPVQYTDYAIWQRRWMEAGERDRQLQYWTTQLAGEPDALELPLDFARPPQQSYRGARHGLALDTDLAGALDALAREQGVTLFMLLLAAYQVLLHRYTGQDDIRVGVPVANRNRVETEGLIGFFTNTQVLRAQVDSRERFSTFLQQVREAVVQGQNHQDLPFEQLVEALRPERSLSHNALFQVMFNHQRVGTGQARQSLAADLTLETMPVQVHTAQFDLTLDTFESESGLSAALTYATDLFEPATIERLGQSWLTLLRGVVADPHLAICDLPLLDSQVQQAQLISWQGEVRHDSHEQTIHAAIQAQVSRDPERLALVNGLERLSYGQLNARANRLARHLVSLGVGPEVRVGVAMVRSSELVVALLAVLKAGGAYVPLDPDYPAERIAYMLENSQAPLLISQVGVIERLAVPTGTQVLCVEPGEQWLSELAGTDLAETAHADNLGYVIYTSGSTGRPKGVAICHRNVAALRQWTARVYAVDDLQGVLASTSVCFDLSVWELFVTLGLGGSIVLARNALELAELPARDEVRLINTVPSAIAALLREGSIGPGVRIVNLAGEPLKQPLVDALYKGTQVRWVYDLYGPSEDTTYSTWTCREAGGRANIGHPLDNTRAYALDLQLNLVPVGVGAELYLAGSGITRGYLANPGLTAERFVPDPLHGNGERMYRTADRVRFDGEGTIQYLGRLDHQVKVRGFRIETGEIEARLLADEQVREAAVLVLDGPHGAMLVAYVVAQQATPTRERLRKVLAVDLPDYMIPAQWVFLEALPLTPNGKLDRKRLPAPDLSEPAHDRQAPANAWEQRLLDVWRAVLKIDQLGVTDNFFEVGGDSIVSIQMVSRARQAGIHFTPKQLFQHQTVRSLASVATADGLSDIDQGEVQGGAPLLPFQRWFFEAPIVDCQHWNQSVLLRSTASLDPGALEQALQALIVHHDALRQSFHPTAGVQALHRSVQQQRLAWQQMPALGYCRIDRQEQLLEVCEQAQRSLDLEAGPLVRAVLIDLPDASQRLLLVIHHLVVDGVSWRILFEDLQQAYRDALQQRPIRLPAKTSSVQAWAQRLQGYATGAAMEHRAYWLAQANGVETDLPRDWPVEQPRNSDGRSVETRLGKELTRHLLQEAPVAYRTQINDLLLAALARTLCAWADSSAVLVELEGHGREELFDDIDLVRTVGWFTSVYPVRLDNHALPGALIKGVKEKLRALPDKGLSFAALRHLGDEKTRAAFAELPQARVTFNYLGQFDGAFSADEQALFAPSGEYAGAEQSGASPMANWLVLNGRVYAGELSLTWSYSCQQYREETVQALADTYARQLAELIGHCCDAETAGVTPSDFPLAELDQQQLDALPISAGQIEDIYPLSPMQQAMLLHSEADSESAFYINQVDLPIHGLQVERLREAWQAAIDRHDILRTSFHWPDNSERPVQVVQRQALLDLRLLDWREQAQPEHAIAELATADRALGFDLARAPLQRITLIRTGEHDYRMLWTSHHILMDGWSSSRLFGEVLEHYHEGQVASPTARYREFIAWLQRQPGEELEQFWKQRLSTLQEPTALSQAIYPRHDSEAAGHEALYSSWDPQQTERLQQFCRSCRVTLNTLVQAAWLLVLQRFTGQRTVAFGSTVAGRPASLANAEQTLGLFINTLPVIQTVEPSQPVKQWLAQLQDYNLDLRDHAHAPLADIQRWSGMGGQPMFDSIIVFENYPIDERLGQAGESELKFGQSNNHDVTNFAMDLAVTVGQRLSIEYLYLRASFAPEAVEAIRTCMEHTLEALAEQAERPVGRLPRLPALEQQAFEQWSRAPQSGHEPVTVTELIARQAVERPEAVAVRCGEGQLTHAQLQQRANALAHVLLAQGIGPETVVGIALERSLDSIVAFLAVHKAGAAYLPLDIDYPAERLAYMIQDCSMKLLVGRDDTIRQLAPQGLACIDMGALDWDGLPSHPPRSACLPEHLAYLIYTSGSTGQPKGVAVTHGPLSMHCQAIAALYEIDTDTRELLFMSFAFDGAQERWLSVLGHGGELVLRDGELWTAEQTCAVLHQRRISIACFPPAYLKQLAEHVRDSGQPAPPVAIYCCGGDAVPASSFELITRVLHPRYLTNGYGPTETVVTPMLWKADAQARCGAAYAPIGRAVGARALYVLDDDLEPLPSGIAGELHIAGEGIARGYHGRPGLTAERFVPDPFGAPGSRQYRSGDRVLRREDGILDYLGRADHQVKLRGFRIELGEIEAALRRQDGVTDALVVARELASGKHLVAYVVGSEGWEIGDGLKERLRQELPDYMVPAYLVGMQKLPVTANGKLDRRALPEPEVQVGAYVAPVSPAQRMLAQIWEQTLQVERVGIHDNFFELGGDSILSLQVVSKVRNHPDLDIDLKLRDLMRWQTIAGLFSREEILAPGREDVSAQLATEGWFALLPIQQWFFDCPMSERHHYNQALMFRPRQALNDEALVQALQYVVAQHDSLRLRFRETDGHWYQSYDLQQAQPLGDCFWREQADDEAALQACVNRAQRSLDPQNGPLYRFVQVDLANGEQRLLMVIHHLVVDAVSWRILLQDLQEVYPACSRGQTPDLQVRSSSYRAWVERLQGQAAQRAARELDYWLECLPDNDQLFPCDNPRGKNQVRYQAGAHFALDADQTSDLLKRAPAAYGSQINDLLLTALGRAICHWAATPTAWVQLEGHGREDLFDELDLSRTLGWFTTMFPVRLDCPPEQSEADALRSVQARLQAVPDKGIGYGVLRHMAGPEVAARMAQTSAARVTFNYLGQFDQSFDDKALLMPAPEGQGDCYSLEAPLGNWLEMVGQVYDGRLSIRCVYSTRRYRAATVERLMQRLQYELQALIVHCVSVCEAGVV
ncbi:amino acid adenylation domain-containing protein [Pantoea sp. Ap-967]|uniref:non-ribosomal peptide synthetase n=1 Tax=Pantoea sp. Ap-967 TaxID=2608362 RepID=UPI0014200869|nr:non-ribosomal peptide synthetase [Pantoea sp. Ap-967]NIE78212.1 amino acid adenylation domain-containing protein [Pantoea sp. Ap-967]